MINPFFKRMAPLVAPRSRTALSGCNGCGNFTINGKEGRALGRTPI